MPPTHPRTNSHHSNLSHHESTVLADADVTPTVAALQKASHNDFRPVWGTDAELTIVPQRLANPRAEVGGSFCSMTPTRPTPWAITTSPRMVYPWGKGFRRQRSEGRHVVDRYSQPRTAGNARRPNINLTVFVQNSKHRWNPLCLTKSCDACEDDSPRLPDRQHPGFPISSIPHGFESFRTEGLHSVRFA